MIKAILLIFAPGTNWQKIADAKHGILHIFFLSLLPLMLLSSFAEGYGLVHWGDKRGEFGHAMVVAQDLVVRYEVVQLVFGLVLVFGGAKLIQWFGHSFHFYPLYSRCFTTTAYGISPIFLARILDALPNLNTWICWAMGASGSVYLLYSGVGSVLEPEQTKGFGLYVLITLVLVLTSGLAHFAALAVLHGRVSF